MGIGGTRQLVPRLDRCRWQLMSVEKQEDSITDIAMRWGFNHLGRFSAMYKKRFGESPRQTEIRVRSAGSAKGRPSSRLA